MLVHLDRNRLSLFDVNQGDLFNMILEVASHTLGWRPDRRSHRTRPPRRNSDEEVKALGDWLRERADWIERGERQVRFRELRRILQSFGYELENPKNNSIDIVRYEEYPVGLFRKRFERRGKRIGSIGFPGDNCFVPLKILKQVCIICRLREEDGVDSASFYDQFAMLDAFVNRYRTVLRRLSRR